MKRLTQALALAIIALIVAPAGIALAVPSFSAGFSIAQTQAGILAPIVVSTPSGPVQVGVTLTGEVFNGSIGSCSGQQCTDVEGASLGATQDATIYFTGVAEGVISFAGPVSGKFTISKTTGNAIHSVSGTYSGLVSGKLVPPPPELGLPPGAYLIQDSNNSQWTVNGSTATGKFNSLQRAFGSITAQLGGVFPGGEVITGTINGVQH